MGLRARWWVQVVQPASLRDLCTPNAGVTDMPLYLVFICPLGIEVRSSHLGSRHFIDRAKRPIFRLLRHTDSLTCFQHPMSCTARHHWTARSLENLSLMCQWKTNYGLWAVSYSSNCSETQSLPDKDCLTVQYCLIKQMSALWNFFGCYLGKELWFWCRRLLDSGWGAGEGSRGLPFYKLKMNTALAREMHLNLHKRSTQENLYML